ncbi:unnamed protein product [Soboliphyme baturini]|uniref:Innexin n=1 Tax=Soboliphyme baturini TaxID=241478 RepID=A0A183J1X5_9BILA|nr:unnamed protein product [Soboliphyme baturini]
MRRNLGINVKGISDMVADVNNMDDGTREKNMKTIASHVLESLELQRELSPSGRLFGFLVYGKHFGIYVTGLYLFIKFMYIVNVICQFFILNSFLGPQYTFWGLEILRDLAYGREWHESGHFPRVTMCDFDVRVLGNLHRWTVQCVLMINMFNEKIYLFLWWWFLIIAILTCINFFYWLFVSISRSSQQEFVARYLRVSENFSDKPGEKRLLQRFVRRMLRPDGVFLLRIVSVNAGDIPTTDLVHYLWRQFREKNQFPIAVSGDEKALNSEGKNSDYESPSKEEKMPLTKSFGMR